MRDPRRVIGACALGLWVLGCDAPVAVDLDEADANQAVVALERGGVGSLKQKDPEHEGHWAIVVARGEAARAIGLLAQENLPPRPAPGVLEALGESSVVPSRLSEQARYAVGQAGELERSLLGVDGVLSARVHLALPAPEGLTPEDNPTHPSASVLIRHRGATPPIATGEVERLVAGAVTDLSPKDVSVVTVSSPRPGLPGGELSRFGPLTVSHGSLASFRGVTAAVLATHLLLIGCILWLWKRARRAAPHASGGEPPEPRPLDPS